MKDERELINEELTDEQANEAAGGKIIRPFANIADKCYICNRIELNENMVYVSIDENTRHVCKTCAAKL